MKLVRRLTIGLLIIISINASAQTSQDSKSDSYRMKKEQKRTAKYFHDYTLFGERIK